MLAASVLVWGRPYIINGFKTNYKLYTINSDNKYGYIDETGKVVIEPKYDSVYGFNDGLAAVRLNDKYGYIDLKGNIIIPPQYENAEAFSEGVAPVSLNGKWGYIDKTNKLVIDYSFYKANCFENGVALVAKTVGQGLESEDRWFYINRKGNIVINGDNKYILHYNCGAACEDSFYSRIKDGLIKVRSSSNNKEGFVDKNNTEKVPLIYDEVRDYSEGLAAIRLNNKVGFIDKKGKVVIACIFDAVEDNGFSEGLVSVFVKGKWGAIDKNGKIVVEPRYVDSFYFKEGLAKVATKVEDAGKNGRGQNMVHLVGNGYIDKTGKMAIEPKYEFASNFCNGLAAVKLNDKLGYIDRSGKEVIPIKYKGAECFDGKLASIQLDDYKQGYINLKGEVVWPTNAKDIMVATSVESKKIDTPSDIIPGTWSYTRYHSYVNSGGYNSEKVKGTLTFFADGTYKLLNLQWIEGVAAGESINQKGKWSIGDDGVLNIMEYDPKYTNGFRTDHFFLQEKDKINVELSNNDSLHIILQRQ